MGYFHDQALSVPVSLTRFEVGKKYQHGWISDAEMKTTWEVVKRSKCFVTIRQVDESSEIARVKTYNYEGAEHCKPFGNYSMCCILSAEKEVN
tara:strand:+ start:276 stop:554 length:279 start_codon:yes stop_codon:yes gene_type:complete